MNDNNSLVEVSEDIEALRQAIAAEKQEIQRLFRSQEFDAMPEVHRRLASLEREVATHSHNHANRMQAGQR